MTVLPFVSREEVHSALPKVAAHLENGGLLAYPTETVYGMGSRLNEADLAALCALTVRPSDKPFLVLVAGEKMARDCGLSFSKPAACLANRFWPGPLTLVLTETEPTLPESLRGQAGGIAVRWSSHPQTSRLIEVLGIPISSTSANRSGEAPLSDVKAIRAEFRDATESGQLLLLDGGVQRDAQPSTLVDCTSAEPTILREGAISRYRIVACLEEEKD
jgi:L-threonylcarbamoyladenylate synthase